MLARPKENRPHSFAASMHLAVRAVCRSLCTQHTAMQWLLCSRILWLQAAAEARHTTVQGLDPRAQWSWPVSRNLCRRSAGCTACVLFRHVSGEEQKQEAAAEARHMAVQSLEAC